LALLLLAIAGIQGCTSISAFPGIARAGDTVSLMVGASTKATKENVSVVLTDVAGNQWDLAQLGLIRSVFNLRPDGRAEGLHYSPYLDVYAPWLFSHEPVQTVLVADLPQLNVTPGPATLTISLNVNDNSSGVSDPFTVGIEIIDGAGQQEPFSTNRPDGQQVDFTRLEPAPHLKVDFRSASQEIGAVSLVIDFNESVISPDDLNVYSPESTVRGDSATSGAFGKTQRMIHWRHDQQRLYVDIIAPQGIDPRYLRLFVMHPSDPAGDPGFSLQKSSVFDVNGAQIIYVPEISYFP
jgi:hypothetical protein